MLPVRLSGYKNFAGLAATRYGRFRCSATISCRIVEWCATADEDGHYCFAVAL